MVPEEKLTRTGWRSHIELLKWKVGTIVVYFNQQTHACTCVRMVENDQKHSKMSKKVPFSSCAREAHIRLTKKNKKKVCWSAIGSGSQKLVDTLTLVTHLEFCCFLFFLLFFVLFVLFFFMHLSCAQWYSLKNFITREANVLWKNFITQVLFFKKAQCFFSSSFLSVFNRFWPCKHMRKHAFAGRNTQHVT